NRRMDGLSEEDLRIQARARGFADELIPSEDEAEQADGELPADVTAVHAKRARELGLHSTNMPREFGGGGCTSLQQVLVQAQMGRVPNALGWTAARTTASTRCSWWTCRPRESGWSGRRPTRTRSATITRSWPSRTCASRRRTWSARRATGWPSPTSGSGSSG